MYCLSEQCEHQHNMKMSPNVMFSLQIKQFCFGTLIFFFFYNYKPRSKIITKICFSQNITVIFMASGQSEGAKALLPLQNEVDKWTMSLLKKIIGIILFMQFTKSQRPDGLPIQTNPASLMLQTMLALSHGLRSRLFFFSSFKQFFPLVIESYKIVFYQFSR